jgi:HSP20 family protein
LAKPEKVKEEPRAVTPWRPHSEIASMEREMDRMFEGFFNPGWNPFFRRAFSRLPRLAVSTPPIDVYAQKDEIIAKVELPGLDKDEIRVNVSDHVLTYKG